MEAVRLIPSCMFAFVHPNYNYLLHRTQNKQTEIRMLNTLPIRILHRPSFRRSNFPGCKADTVHCWDKTGCSHYRRNKLLHRHSNHWLHHTGHMWSDPHNQDNSKCRRYGMLIHYSLLSWTCSNLHHRTRMMTCWHQSNLNRCLHNHSWRALLLLPYFSKPYTLHCRKQLF